MRTLFTLLISIGFCLVQPVLAGPISGAQKALNELRSKNNLPPLSFSTRLQDMSEGHAQEMSRRGYFSHTGADGSDIAERAARVGYGYCALAENIAKGQSSLGEVMEAWENSKGHRDNMLNRQVSEFGLARAAGDVWVMVLGRDGC